RSLSSMDPPVATPHDKLADFPNRRGRDTNGPARQDRRPDRGEAPAPPLVLHEVGGRHAPEGSHAGVLAPVLRLRVDVPPVPVRDPRAHRVSAGPPGPPGHPPGRGARRAEPPRAAAPGRPG